MDQELSAGKVLMRGTLCPCDGVPGCTFTVEETEDRLVLMEDKNRRYKVVIRSPYGGHHIVDEATLRFSEVMGFLLDRSDY